MFLCSPARRQPFLPAPRNESDAPATRNGSKANPSFRRFVRRQYHIFVFFLMHIFFSLYIRFRQAYHAVADRIQLVYYHHHRTPELIQHDVKGLRRLPKHLSVILTLEDQRRTGAALEKLMNEVTNVAAWAASAGIPQLSIYEKTGAFRIRRAVGVVTDD